MIKYKLLIDFQSTGAAEWWKVSDDSLAGAPSQNRLVVTPEKTAIFEGNTGNHFPAIWSRSTDFFLDGLRGLAIRVKGDGKQYLMSLITSGGRENFEYRQTFGTEAGIWTTPYFPFTEFRPFLKDEPLAGPPLDSAEVRQIGFTLAAGQAGVFRLEIEWIKAYLDY